MTRPVVDVQTRPATKALATATRATSIQPRFRPGRRDELVNRVYLGIIALGRQADEAPRRGDPRRDVYLRDLVRSGVEPILTGAISSMVSRFVALGWTVTGGRNKAARARSLLANAEDAKGWHVFLSKVVEDMLVTDKGGFFEMATLGRHGPVRGLFNLDATACALTGNPRWPVMYTPKVGRNNKQRPLDRDHVMHLPPMPSPDEAEFNLSLSPVSRALRAAQILRAINDHDTEKLRKLPPEGIMTVTNITETQWKDVLENYREARKKENMSVFPGIMVIAGQSITQPPQIDLTPFSTLPDGFDKKETVEIYVKTLALALGVDVAELWLIPQVGATKAAFTIQHMKARGKGIGLIVSILERALNFSVMPQGVIFNFDLPDDEQDLAKAEIEGVRISNVVSMYETERVDEEGLVTRQEGRQILATQGILSPAFAESEEVTLFDVAKGKMRGTGPFSGNGDEEIVTLDRQGRIVGVVLPVRKAVKVKEEAAYTEGTEWSLSYKGHTGVMVAFFLPEPLASELSLRDSLGDAALPPEDLHMTLAFLGDSTEFPVQKEQVLEALEDFAKQAPPIQAVTTGMGKFVTAEEDDSRALYVSFSAPGLPAWREALVEKLAEAGIRPSQRWGFTPHATLAYIGENDPFPLDDVPVRPIVWDIMTLAWGDERHEFKLQGPIVQISDKQLDEELDWPFSDEALATLIRRKQDQAADFLVADEQYKLDLITTWRKESGRVVRAMQRLRKGRKKSLLARIVKQEDEDDLTEEEAAALLLLLRQAVEELSEQGRRGLTSAYTEALGVGEGDLDSAQLEELEALVESNDEFLFGSFLPDVEKKTQAFGLSALAEKLATFDHRIGMYSSAFFGAIIAGLAFGKKADVMFFWSGLQDSGTCSACSPLIGKTMEWKDRPFTPGDGSSPVCDGG